MIGWSHPGSGFHRIPEVAVATKIHKIGDRGLDFVGLTIRTRCDENLQAKLTIRLTSDPEAAIAWLQPKTAASDFRDGSIARRKNRALVFGSLVKGVAEKGIPCSLILN